MSFRGMPTTDGSRSKEAGDKQNTHGVKGSNGKPQGMRNLLGGSSYSQRIHGTGIYTYNVGEYIPYMDPLGFSKWLRTMVSKSLK